MSNWHLVNLESLAQFREKGVHMVVDGAPLLNLAAWAVLYRPECLDPELCGRVLELLAEYIRDGRLRLDPQQGVARAHLARHDDGGDRSLCDAGEESADPHQHGHAENDHRPLDEFKAHRREQGKRNEGADQNDDTNGNGNDRGYRTTLHGSPIIFKTAAANRARISTQRKTSCTCKLARWAGSLPR